MGIGGEKNGQDPRHKQRWLGQPCGLRGLKTGAAHNVVQLLLIECSEDKN